MNLTARLADVWHGARPRPSSISTTVNGVW